MSCPPPETSVRKIRESAELTAVRSALDGLTAAGETYQGLFPSVLEVETGEMPFMLPPEIAGQRDCDRSFPGSNLMHDHVVLKLMYDLAEAIGERRFAVAADRYLTRFATHCTETPTGLFPWGEHGFWHLMEDRPGSGYGVARVATMATHDHLQQAPEWLWEKLWGLNADAVERFCQALPRHYLDVAGPPEYNRHTNLLQPHHLKRKRGPTSADFPRHSGFYIFDWSFAYARTGSPLYRSQIVRAADYWWEYRREGVMLPFSSRRAGAFRANAMQTMSLADSLLQAAQLVEERDGALAQMLRERGTEYLNTVLAAPHDPANGLVVLTLDADAGEIESRAPAWGSAYGMDDAQAGTLALLMLCAYRINGDERLLEFAGHVGRFSAASEMPENAAVPAKDAGVLLELLTDLYSLTGERSWLEHAQKWAERIRPLYCDHALPRGATGISIYESQLLPGHLLRGLARTALMADGVDIGCDYTLR